VGLPHPPARLAQRSISLERPLAWMALLAYA